MRYTNDEGYPDPTAAKAIEKIEDDIRERELAGEVAAQCLRKAKEAGFTIVNISLMSMKTKAIYEGRYFQCRATDRCTRA